MTTKTDTKTAVTKQIYRVWIKATPEAIWDAITKPEWTEKYGYTGHAHYDMRPGGAFRVVAGPSMEAHGVTGLMVEGEVIEANPPRRLVQTWRLVMSPELAAEPFTRLTYDIEPGKDGVTKLTVTHDLDGAPNTAALVGGELEHTGAGGGWAWVLSGFKSLLETGSSLAA